MGLTVFNDGFFTVSVEYVSLMRGSFYYYRRIPSDVRKFYGGRLFRKISLRTRDLREAARKAASLVAQDTARWEAMRGNIDLTPKVTRDLAAGLLADLGPGDALRRPPSSDDPSPLEVLSDHFEARHGWQSLDEARWPDGDTSESRTMQP
jgi:hypothetical protein